MILATGEAESGRFLELRSSLLPRGSTVRPCQWQRRLGVNSGHCLWGLCHNYPWLILSGLESFQDHTQRHYQLQRFCSKVRILSFLEAHPTPPPSDVWPGFSALGAGLTMDGRAGGWIEGAEPQLLPRILLNILSKRSFHQRNFYHAPHRLLLSFNKAFTGAVYLPCCSSPFVAHTPREWCVCFIIGRESRRYLKLQCARNICTSSQL